MTKKQKTKKAAFTLAEMMVVMLVLSVVLAASMPIITRRTGALGTSTLWRPSPSDANKIYYGTTVNQQVMVGTNTPSANVTGQNAMLYINTPNADTATYPQIAFGANGDYAGVLYAKNNGSIAMGKSSTASGEHSIAIGEDSKASGKGSIAFGYNAQASGSNSIAIGHDTSATTESEVNLNGVKLKPIKNDAGTVVGVEICGIVLGPD